MDGKQLKNSILQWAIQGKLVPQNPKDEPAQKLLERIAAARNEYSAVSACHPERSAKGTKSKDLKKKTSKNQPSRIYCENGVWYEQIGSAAPKDVSDEIPFEIPENWAWCRLAQLAEIQSSKRVFEKDYVTTGIPFFRSKEIGELSRGESIHTELYITKQHYKELKEKYGVPQVGDILLTSVGSIGNLWICDGREFYYKDGNVTQICSNSSFDSQYVALYLSSPLFFEQIRSSVAGTAYNALTIIKLKSLILPLPPLAEQKRIVAKLEQVLPLAEEYGAAQEQLDKLNKELPEALKKSILQEAIQGKLVPQNPKDEPASALLAKIQKEKEALVKQGKLKKKDLECVPIEEEEIPFEIPDSWTWVRFESIAQRIVGKTPERGNSSYWSKTGYPWVTISDMSDYGHVKATKEFISEKACNLMGTISPKDSLLMSFKLTVGRTSILDIAAYHNEAIITVLPYYDKENILRDYLFTFLPLISLTGKSKDAIKGMTLNSKSIAALLIPLPPLAEQKRIIAKLEQLFKVL